MANALPYKNLAPYSNAVKHVVGAIADVDMRQNCQYLCVQRTSTGTLAPASNAGVQVTGILQDKPNVGEECLVMDEGDSPAIAGAAITSGQPLMVNASGQLVPASGTNIVVAVAQGDAPAAGAQLTVHLTP